jgi:hypothetical protein
MRSLTVLAAFAVLLFPGVARAQAPSVGPILLNLPAGPKPAALGNAWVSASDRDAIFYNPAQIGRGGTAFDLSVTRHGNAGTATTLTSGYTAGKWSMSLGWGIRFLDFSTSPAMAYPYAPDALLVGGSADGASALVVVGGAFVYKGFRIGAAGKYATDRVTMPAAVPTAPSISRQVFVADFGVSRSLFRGTGAVSVQNLGGDSRQDDVTVKLPRQVLLGWSRSRTAGPLDLAVYTQATLRDGWTSAGAGLEASYGWIEGYSVALRVGARRTETSAEQPVAFGAAFTADRLTVEYGVQFFDGGRTVNGVTIRWR